MATQQIYALFQDVADAERAIGALEDHGIGREHIGVVARRAAEQPEAARVRADYVRISDPQGLRQNEPEAGYVSVPGTLPPATLAGTSLPASSADTPENVETVGKEGLTTTTPQDAAAGAAVGSGVGLVAGLLATAAALTVPGVGLVLAGGALASALGATVAATAAGAVAGGAAGYLRDMGMPEHAAVQAADRLREGDYLLAIAIDPAQYDDVKRLLLKYNAIGVDDSSAGAAGVGFDSAPPETALPATPARIPANPALAQETEPMEYVQSADDLNVVEQARATERETRDAIT